MRILISDDDRMCRIILRKSLEKLGHMVLESEDGNDAWDKFQHWAPDVVISDWMMPGKSGLDLCNAIRSDSSVAYTYFILLTALNDKDSVLRGLEAGADDYLTKPLDSKELQARLISATRVTNLHRELDRLNKELFKEGRTDPLTQVGNRRFMEEELQQTFDRAVRYSRSFAVALCDIDYFKNYNDQLGHQMGDDALRKVAQILKTSGRLGDYVFRYGGEEFLVILPGQSVEKARLAMERRRIAVLDAKIDHPSSGVADHITVSIGIAVFDPNSDKSVDNLVERADEALYRAKSQGRNQLIVHSLSE